MNPNSSLSASLNRSLDQKIFSSNSVALSARRKMSSCGFSASKNRQLSIILGLETCSAMPGTCNLCGHDASLLDIMPGKSHVLNLILLHRIGIIRYVSTPSYNANLMPLYKIQDKKKTCLKFTQATKGLRYKPSKMGWPSISKKVAPIYSYDDYLERLDTCPLMTKSCNLKHGCIVFWLIATGLNTCHTSQIFYKDGGEETARCRKARANLSLIRMLWRYLLLQGY